MRLRKGTEMFGREVLGGGGSVSRAACGAALLLVASGVAGGAAAQTGTQTTSTLFTQDINDPFSGGFTTVVHDKFDPMGGARVLSSVGISVTADLTATLTVSNFYDVPIEFGSYIADADVFSIYTVMADLPPDPCFDDDPETICEDPCLDDDPETFCEEEEGGFGEELRGGLRTDLPLPQFQPSVPLSGVQFPPFFGAVPAGNGQVPPFPGFPCPTCVAGTTSTTVSVTQTVSNEFDPGNLDAFVGPGAFELIGEFVAFQDLRLQPPPNLPDPFAAGLSIALTAFVQDGSMTITYRYFEVDFDTDGSADASDIQAYLASLAAGDAAADVDGVDGLNYFDLLAYLEGYDAFAGGGFPPPPPPPPPPFG